MEHDIEWNMAGEPEWKDEMPPAVGSVEELLQRNKQAILASMNAQHASMNAQHEYWILRRTLDGWRLVSEKPVGDPVLAADNIRVMSPGTYKILETVAAYKSEIELLPLTED